MTIVMPRPGLPASALMWLLATAAHAGIPPRGHRRPGFPRGPAASAALPADAAGEDDSAEDEWAAETGTRTIAITETTSSASATQRSWRPGNAAIPCVDLRVRDQRRRRRRRGLDPRRYPVTGPVEDSAVSCWEIPTSTQVGGDVVAVLGNMELAPRRDRRRRHHRVRLAEARSDAIVHGDMQSVMGGEFGGVDWLRAWIDHGLLYGRPLALHRELGWAWGLALMFLALYACIALLFRTGISRCVHTLETYPGMRCWPRSWPCCCRPCCSSCCSSR